MRANPRDTVILMSIVVAGFSSWLALATLQGLLLSASCGKHHRRSMPTQSTLPLSKGGWRPVIGSSGLLYGTFNTAPLHAPSYKIPIPLDLYPSSARPVAVRDATKLTSIAQSYRPTTLRTVPISQPPHQPINSYHNPFAYPNNFNYKFVQNYPVDSVMIRNPHNPYAARPVFTKYPQKFKQPYPMQLGNVQQFSHYPTSKPIENYMRPLEQKKQQSTEIYKIDSETAPQSINQQVKTVQQQNLGAQKMPINQYANYAFQDSILPPNILGSFGTFGLQTVRGRDPVYPAKTTYLPPQPTRQTIFNSFNYSPNFKTTPAFYTTTPKLLTTPNHFPYQSTYSDVKAPVVSQTQATKAPQPQKIDPNAGKFSFKASPQDPFIKNYKSNLNQVSVTTYNPLQTSTPNVYYEFSFPSQQTSQAQNYYNQQNLNFNYDKKKNKIHSDSIAAGVNQLSSQQFANPPKKLEPTQFSQSYKPTYEVTENFDSDVITHSSPALWTATPESYNIRQTEESVTNQESPEAGGKPTPTPDFPEEYAIVTEGEKGYENSLGYDNQVESQSRRPLGDDFEPIGKHKLKDYYYKVSTPTYEHRRTKKPTEPPKQELTTAVNVNEVPVEALPTLPPNQHFKRPSGQDSGDKDKIRKRTKVRRRRPPLANINRDRDNKSSTEATITTEPEEHSYRPRVRPTKLKPQSGVTTPSITTDSTTSGLPTLSPTTPTIIKKKLVHRRPYTTTSEKVETTTQVFKDNDNKDSSIMKIANRHHAKTTSSNYEYRTSETPDYSHKQDEKDTPTSDIAVDTIKTTQEAESFSFHRDVKPIEANLEPVKESTTKSLKDITENINEVTTYAPRAETTTQSHKILRPRLKNKYDRPRFSVKDYRNRLSSTTSTTEKSAEPNTPRIRFPQRRLPNSESNFNIENDNGTERKKFMPKDPRHKNKTDSADQVDKETYSTRQPLRRATTVDLSEPTTQKISSRIRNGARRPRPTEPTDTTEYPTTSHNKRPLRKKIKDTDLGESVQDILVTDNNDQRDITSERTRSESAIMKIADKKHQDHHIEHIFEHSKRVSDLTLAASKDYNTPGMFKTVAANSRRIPSYFTIATDDPILPIEAFFPQLNQKKES